MKKSNLCKGCLLSEVLRKLHKRVRDVDRATHVLHIDIAGPYIESHEGHHYFLVGALRLPNRPLLIDARLLKTRTSVEVCAALERMTSFLESLSFEGFEITDSPRIKRLHSDRDKESSLPLYFQKFLSNHRSIYHTLTTGYDPQANGTAERSVGLMKALSARCLTTSGLPQEFWGYAVKYSPRQNDVISTKPVSELLSKNLSSQLQQTNSPRNNFISTFLSQQFWAGFGSGRARWVRASLVSALSSCPRLCRSAHASKSPQKSPKLDVNKKSCHFENSESEISQQKILAELFSKKCHLKLNNLFFLELVLT